MTDPSPSPSRPDQAGTAGQAINDRPSPAVSAFVAAMITAYRRSHGLDQLLADVAAGDDETAETDRTSARDALGV